MDHNIYSSLRLFLLLIKIYISEPRLCPEAIGSIEYVLYCPTSKQEWDTAASKKNCSRLASLQNCSSAEQFKYHCVINGFRNETLEVCAPSRIIFGHCVEFNLLGGVIQDQMSSPCNSIFPKCDAIFRSTDAYKYPDCFDLVAKCTTTVDTTERIVLTTTTITDKSRTLIAVIVSTGTMTILFVSLFIAVVVCKRKRQSAVLKERQPADTEQDQLFDTQEKKENAPYKIYAKEALSETAKQLQKNLSQKSKMSEMNM